LLLTKDSILKASDLKTADVDVPEWGGKVRVRTMTGADRQAFYKSNTSKDGMPKNMLEALIVATAIDEKGEHMFTASDVSALASKSSIALQRVWDKAAEINGLTQKSVEDIAGE
jgi:hypothetical protein